MSRKRQAERRASVLLGGGATTGILGTLLFCLVIIIHAHEGYFSPFGFSSCTGACTTYARRVCLHCNCAETQEAPPPLPLSSPVYPHTCQSRAKNKTAGTQSPDQSSWKRPRFFSPPRSESKAGRKRNNELQRFRADGLFKIPPQTTVARRWRATLPDALIASNEVMKGRTRRRQPELSSSPRCCATCLCAMSGN